MKTGPPDLTVKIENFDRRRKGKDHGAFILEVSEGRFGCAPLSIHHKQDVDVDFEIEANSAVLWDIIIYPEQWRRKGIGSEWLGFMKEFAKSQRAERFYAHNVQTENEGFFVKMGFVRTDNPYWWIMKDF
jgi:GNAT superfamily N-acetyltransferase